MDSPGVGDTRARAATWAGESLGALTADSAPILAGYAIGTALGRLVGALGVPAGIRLGPRLGGLAGATIPSLVLNHGGTYDLARRAGLDPAKAADKALAIGSASTIAAGAVGLGLYRLLAPRGPASTRSEMGREWMARMAGLVTLATLPRFLIRALLFERFDVNSLAQWAMAVVFLSGIAFMFGWAHGYLKLPPNAQATDGGEGAVSSGAAPPSAEGQDGALSQPNELTSKEQPLSEDSSEGNRASPSVVLQPPEDGWFLTVSGVRRGPYSGQALVASLCAEPSPREVLVWRRGLTGWIRAGEVAEIADELPPPPPTTEAAPPGTRATPAIPSPPTPAHAVQRASGTAPTRRPTESFQGAARNESTRSPWVPVIWSVAAIVLTGIGVFFSVQRKAVNVQGPSEAPPLTSPRDPQEVAFATEDEKIAYAAGLMLGRNLVKFNLSQAELEAAEMGLVDSASGRPTQVDLQTYGPKIQAMIQSRAPGRAVGKKDSTALPGAPAVSSVTLGNAIGEDKQVTAPLETFAAKDTIYASVQTAGTGHIRLRALWIFSRGTLTAKVVDSTTIEFESSAPATNEFHVAKPSGWPKGDYRVEIFLGDAETPAIVKAFRVNAPGNDAAAIDPARRAARRSSELEGAEKDARIDSDRRRTGVYQALWRANEAARRGELEAAKKGFEEALAFDGSSAEAQAGLAKTVRRQRSKVLGRRAAALGAVGRYDEATACYRDAIDLDPDDLDLRRTHTRFSVNWVATTCPVE